MSGLNNTAGWGALSVAGPKLCGPTTCRAGASYPLEKYRDFDLWIAIRGAGDFEMLGRRWHFQAGHVLLVPPGIGLRLIVDDSAPLVMHFAHFDLLLNGRLVRSIKTPMIDGEPAWQIGRLPPLAPLMSMDTQSLILNFAAFHQPAREDFHDLQFASLILRVLGQLRRKLVAPTVPPRDPRIEAVLQFCEQRLDQDLTVEDLAAVIHVSDNTLRRLFHRHCRRRPMQMLNTLRMDRARRLLLEQQDPIKQVSWQCGFRSAAHFCHVFQREHGESPLAFRRRHTGPS